MTFAGDCILGLPVGTGMMPQPRPFRNRFGFLAVFTLLAFISDLSLPYRRRHWYLVSHSLFVNFALIALILSMGLIPQHLKREWGVNRTVFYGTLVWLSHLVLDALYNHGNGIRIFWPFEGRLILPLPWFEVLTLPVISSHNPRLILIEILAFSPLVVLAVILRRIWITGRSNCYWVSKILLIHQSIPSINPPSRKESPNI